MAQTFEELKKTLDEALNNFKNTVEQVPGTSLEVNGVLLNNYKTLQAVIVDYIRLRQDEDERTPAAATVKDETKDDNKTNPPTLPGTQKGNKEK